MEHKRNDITSLSKLGEMGNGYPVQTPGYGYNGGSFSQGSTPSIGSMGQMTQQPMMSPVGGTQYQPLNIHQNPYGHPPPQNMPPMGHPSFSNGSGPGFGGGGGGGNVGGQLPTISVEELRSSRSGPLNAPPMFDTQPMYDTQQSMYDTQPQIPCRGVEMDPTRFSNDPESQPNYLPPVKLTTDYLKDFELETAKLATEYQKDKYRKDHLENVWGEIQIPILLGVLFFLFQLPYWNIIMYRYLKVIGLFGEDGNINIYGIFIKSMLFGICCYGVTLL